MKTNQTLQIVADIEARVLSDCGTLNLEAHEDRARIAWWIFNNFCAKDFRETITKKKTTGGPFMESSIIVKGKGGPEGVHA